MQKIFIIIILIFINVLGYSQKISSKSVYDRNTNKVYIKWMPESYILAKEGFQVGYEIKRFVIEDDKISGEITLDHIFPYSIQDWESLNSVDLDIIGAAKKVLSDTEVQINDDEKFDPDTLTNTKLLHAYYIKEHRDGMYFLMQMVCDRSIDVARGLGLAYVDDYMIDPSKTYGYTITMLGDSLYRSYTIMDVSTLDSLKQPELLPTESGDKKIKLFWKMEEQFQYASYDIYRSEDNLTFTKINDDPYIFLSAIS